MLKNSTTHAQPLPRDLDEVSQRLVRARAGGEALPGFPGNLPDRLDEAYAVQSASIARWPQAIAGWKVGMVPSTFRAALGDDRLCGPIFRPSVHDIEPGGSISMPIYRGGFAAVEAEFAFRLGVAIEPVVRDYSDSDLVDRIAALHVSAEIASSPMADINRLGPCCVVCDFGNNAGLVVGPNIPDWHALPANTLLATVTVDGTVVGQASADSIEGGLLQALRFLITLSARRGLTLPEGTYVSCGAVTGIHDVTTDSQARVDFGPYGAFDVAFEPVRPTDASAGTAGH